MKRLTLLGLALAFHFLLFAQSIPVPGFTLSTASGQPGDTVCLDLRAVDFQGVFAAQFTLRWDTAELRFVEIRNVQWPGLRLDSGVNLDAAATGRLPLVWDVPTAVTLPDSTLLFELCLRIGNNAPAGFYPVDTDDDFLAREVVYEPLAGGDIIASGDVPFSTGGVNVMTDAEAFRLEILAFSREICGDAVPGLIVSPQNGQPPYTYEFLGVEKVITSADTIFPLPPGTYIIHARDAEATMVSAQYTLAAGSQPFHHGFLDAADVQPAECTSNNGRIELNLPQPPDRFSIYWNNGATTAVREALAPGTYSVLVQDQAGCTDWQQFTVAKADVEFEIMEKVTPAECGQSNGSIELILLPQAGYSYAWSTGGGDNTITNLPAGVYQVTVTHPAGCTQTHSILVEPQPEPFRVLAYVECNDRAAGDATVTDTYLTAEVIDLLDGPYHFSWNQGAVEDTAYYRSSIVLPDTATLVSVSAGNGTSGERQLAYVINETFRCPAADAAIQLLAPDVIVEPGASFRYPIRVTGWSGRQAIRRLVWDPCLLQLDSVTVYTYQADTIIASTRTDASFWQEGFTLLEFKDFDYNLPLDTLPLLEFFFSTSPGSEGYVPFLFITDEYALGQVRAHHGSVTIASPEQLVVPGDTDNNTRIDQYDLLPIGLGYGQEGPQRSVRGSGYTIPWPYSTPTSEVNYRHLDTDGNGRINAADTIPILQNWSPGEADDEFFSPQVRSTGAVLFVQADTLVPNSTASLPIILGTADAPAEDVYGLAFSLRYDGRAIDVASVWAEMTGNWLGTELTLVRHDTLNRRLHLALVRTDGASINGFGPIGRLHLHLSGSDGMETVTFTVEHVRLISAAEEVLPVRAETTTATVTGPTNVRESYLATRIRLYPNPAGDHLFIESGSLTIQSVEVLTGDGRTISSRPFTRQLDVQALPEGLYLLRMVLAEGVAVKRFVKR